MGTSQNHSQMTSPAPGRMEARIARIPRLTGTYPVTRREWAAELAALPCRDQAPHAFRLLSHAWSLRQELNEKPPKNPRSVLIVVGVVVPGADALAAVCGLDWPAAV